MTRGRKPQKRSMLAGKRFETARNIFGKSYEALVDDPRWIKSIGIFDTKTVRGWVKTGIPQNRVARLAEYLKIPAYMLVDYALSDQVFERHVYEAVAGKDIPGTDTPAVPYDMPKHNFDAFILHAKEDTLIFVRPLSDALARMGLKAQYEGYALKEGHDLIRMVSKGLSISRDGMLICSEAFFQYDWQVAELNELAEIEINGRKPIVGIGYGVDQRFVARYSQKLASRIVACTPSIFNHLASQLSEFLHPKEEKLPEGPAMEFEKPFETTAHRSKSSIKAVVLGEVVAIKEKAQRYLDGRSSREEMSASTPLLTSIATELLKLPEEQVVAYRRVVTLDMEMRKSGNKDKAGETLEACETALSIFDYVSAG